MTTRETIDRRRLLATGGGAGALVAAGFAPWRSAAPVLAQATPEAGGTPNAGATPIGSDYAAEVDVGLAYFRARAEEQVPLVEAMVEAIAGGDIEAAKAAYVAARPPYEEIEVLAAGFPETDADIDARPYAFDGGETDPAYRGFHRIESLLFRDGDLAAAQPFAETLLGSARTLIDDLATRENFSAAGHFDGMVALANEVASKKISSEEETWSDQSLLIFRHNWLGIASQFDPFAPAVQAGDPAAADEVTTAVEAALSLVEPSFAAGSVAAAPYSGVGPAERGRIVAASYRLRDALVAAREVLGIA